MAAVLLALDLWQQLGERGRFTPGVSDNASGVAVLLALAELFGANPPEVLSVGYLFTAAEECGLYGAEAFARLLKQRGLRPNVVAVDMVGSGSRLRLVRESGPIFPVRSDTALNGWIERAEPEMQPLAFTRRSSDFAAFARNGIPAAWVESNGTPSFWRAYHTLQDGLALADAAMLGRSAAALTRLVLLLERDKSR
jgi:Zn-dependent M28 family amino/carboxypeptidase